MLVTIEVFKIVNFASALCCISSISILPVDAMLFWQ